MRAAARRARSDRRVGYIANHENHNPEELIENCVLAQSLGFDMIWNSDHFLPWGHNGGNSTLSWIWMAALAERCRATTIGTAVTSPGYRYHPAIVAQSFATLGRLYEGRIVLGLGLGEALNEYPLGYAWPQVGERVARFRECLRIIRLLWRGEFVDFEGEYYSLKGARLYTRPETAVPIHIASQGPVVSSMAGEFADGYMFSINAHPLEEAKKLYQEVCWPAVERGAKRAGRDPKLIQRVGTIFVSYNKDYEKAVRGCRFWAGAFAAGGALTNRLLVDPREIDRIGMGAEWSSIEDKFIVATDAETHIKALGERFDLGFDQICITSCSPDEKEFLRFYSKEVMPYVRVRY